MKFIRDIISERSDETPHAAQTAPDRAEDEFHDVAPRQPYKDRTMTRLTDPEMMDDEDVFKRLLGEDMPPSVYHTDPAEDLPQPAAPVSKGARDVPENLFGDFEDDCPEDDFHEVSQQRDPVRDHTRPFEPDTAPQAMEPPVNKQSFQDPSTAFPAMSGRSMEPETPPDASGMVAVPAPASGRSGRGAGRVKTRLLGFGAPEAPVNDPFDTSSAKSESAKSQPSFPVGWLVVVDGPGRGASFPLSPGVSQIGRGDDQAICLDFGDTSISRSNHAAIAYDAEQGGFYVGHGGKANMVRLNERPVLSTEEMTTGAMIRIGETTLRFVALCDGTFSWNEKGL